MSKLISRLYKYQFPHDYSGNLLTFIGIVTASIFSQLRCLISLKKHTHTNKKTHGFEERIPTAVPTIQRAAEEEPMALMAEEGGHTPTALLLLVLHLPPLLYPEGHGRSIRRVHDLQKRHRPQASGFAADTSL